MILLESQGEVDRHREILRPFKPARQAELPAPLITLNISPRSQASFTVSKLKLLPLKVEAVVEMSPELSEGRRMRYARKFDKYRDSGTARLVQ